MKKPTHRQLALLKYMDESFRCFHKDIYGWYYWLMPSSFNIGTPTANACINNGWIEKDGDNNRYFIGEAGKKAIL